MLVKEYMEDATHIRIFDDYCKDKDENSEIKNIIISLLLKNLNNNLKFSNK